MTQLNFRQGARALIIGASGGIGHALAGIVSGSGAFASVLSAGRSSGDIRIDITDQASVREGLARAAEGAPLDLIIVATGILHADGVEPEKTLRAVRGDAMAQVLAINTIGPALVFAEAMAHLPRSDRSVVAALSARVGSISDNRLGGWVSYRASKAALNQVIRTVSVEWARTHRHAIALGLHPGTVDTALSKPFQANVPDGKLFTPQHSAEALWEVIRTARPQMSGRVYDYAGEEVPA